jgi:recombination protein RecR
MEYPSRLIEHAVQAFASLPGIGKKTAMRLVVHLLKESPEFTQDFSEAISKMRSDIKFCSACGNVSDHDQCGVCLNPARDHSLLCVVENFRDILAIENTGHYKGVYHVLGGLIAPLDGIGPEQLNIAKLLQRAASGEVKEIIMALNPTIEGDTTLFYLSRQLSAYPVSITTLARGVAFGGELEFVDEVTLARSIMSRRPYDNYMTGQ